jgi:3-methyladenine DNA glycosylase AlkD
VTSVKQIKSDLQQLSSKEDARQLQRFFKTGQGQYGEGDLFLGIRVPVLRKLASQYGNVSIDDAACLLRSKFHEERMLALIILVNRYRKGNLPENEAIYQIYLGHTKYINNWDLVDTSAEHIVGAHLLNRDRKILYALAVSDDLWERRISILSTFHFIRRNQFDDSLAISRILLNDREDLIHKAVGWMLREVGKRDIKAEESFLIKHYREMPRTMLRYAIEKFPEANRRKYLRGEI